MTAAEPSREFTEFFERVQRRKPRDRLQHGNFKYVWASEDVTPRLVEEVQPAVEVHVEAVMYGEFQFPEPLLIAGCMGFAPQGRWKNLDHSLVQHLVKQGRAPWIGMRQADGSTWAVDGFLYLDVDSSSLLDLCLAVLHITAEPGDQHRWRLEAVVNDKTPFKRYNITDAGETLAIGDVSPVHYLSMIAPRTYHLYLDNVFRGPKGDRPPQVFENAHIQFRVSYPGTLGGDPEMPMAPIQLLDDLLYVALHDIAGLDLIQSDQLVLCMKNQGGLDKPDQPYAYRRQHLFDALERFGIRLERQKLYDLVVAVEQPKETSQGF